MNITTKLNPGDEAWIMRDNYPTKVKIDSIDISIDNECRPHIIYIEKRGWCRSEKVFHSERNVFATKEELLNSFL